MNNDKHEVISAFLDNEPFEPDELSGALADADGRALLIDLVALRQLTQPDEASMKALTTPRRWSPLGMAAAAAALVLAVAGGYRLGDRSDTDSVAPPPATRTVSAGATWQDLP